MSESTEHQKIITQLELLNTQIRTQNSFSRMFVVGIIYGLGFFIGSAIFATIGFGIIAPFFEEVPWVQEKYERGAAVPHR